MDSHTRLEKVGSIVWFVLSCCALVVILLKLFVFQQVNVIGVSMQPNFYEGQKLLLNKVDKKLERGQVVAFFESKNVAEHQNIITKIFPNLNSNSTLFLLKRVIALPGEAIEIVGSKVIIYNDTNPEGFILQEDYISEAVKTQMEQGCLNYGIYFKKYTIPADHYFLMGDNRCNSKDSRDSSFGAFESAQLLGKEVARYWPLTDWQAFELPIYHYSAVDAATKSKIQDLK